MNRMLPLALLSALSLPLSAQRYEPVPQDPVQEPFAVSLQVDQEGRVAVMASAKGEAFFGFMIASTGLNMLDIPGIGGLLDYELIVATALCMDGKMGLGLGVGGWGFDVYLQGAAMSERGVALSNVAVVSDPVAEPKK